jgi:hypothetical protein
MNGRVLANASIFALGIIMIIGGGWAIWHGSGYIQLEWGWSSVIAGAIAATGGVLTLAVGFVLQRLDAVHGLLLRAWASTIALPAESFPADEPAKESIPLAGEVPPSAPRMSEPQPAAYPDPAVQAAAVVNLELLAHEERPAPAAQVGEHEATRPGAGEEAAASEAPPEVVHAADQGPADDMVKAAGVGDEPELDAAIEELLAEERGRPPSAAPAVELPPASSEAVSGLPDPRTALAYEESGKAPQRAGGWRGLFSRKDRRAAIQSPAEQAGPAEQPAIQPGQEPGEQPAAGGASAALADEQAARHPAPSADAIPRTGDDWFDRALSGMDEVAEPYEASGQGGAGETPAEENAQRSAPELRAQAAEPIGGAPPSEPAVIGRYTSGNTTYVMFADGSIEAETPNGVLRFASLADLKVYVEGGQ